MFVILSRWPLREVVEHHASLAFTKGFFFPSTTAASKRRGQGRKVDVRRLLKTWRKLILTKRIPIVFPLSRSIFRSPLKRKVIPLGLRIQRFKISLAPLKRMLKQSKAYSKLLSYKNKKGKSTHGKTGTATNSNNNVT